MQENTFHQPDAAAIRRLLEIHCCDPSGLVLRLAWRAGLTREEIARLSWEQVDLDARLLRLPDREVPLEPETAGFLSRWKKRVEKHGPLVAVSRRRKAITPASVSVMARRALDAAGQGSVRFTDLRQDYIRRQFAEHDWPYAVRVTGLSVTTYRNGLARRLGPGPAPDGAAAAEDGGGEEYQFWKILQRERGSPAGIALWLTSQLGLRLEEIVRLTWEQVDFAADILRLPDREAPLTAGTRRVLEEAYARRKPGEDGHVLLTPQTRRPMDAARLATLTRDALIRGGITGRTAGDFRKTAAGAERRSLLAYAREHGSVSRAEAMELLGLSEAQAYDRLRKLSDGGALVLLKNRYYPAEAAVRPEDRERAVLRYLAEYGGAYRQNITDMLVIGKRATADFLRGMTEAGDIELLRPEWRYVLTEQGRKKLQV